MQFCVHTTFGVTDHTSTPPFFNPSLEAVRCALSKHFEEKRSCTTDARPQLKECLNYVRDGDQPIVTRIDRLARSTLHLCQIAKSLREKGVDLVVLDQNTDTQMQPGGCCSTCSQQSASSKPKSALNVSWTGSKSRRSIWKTTSTHRSTNHRASREA